MLKCFKIVFNYFWLYTVINRADSYRIPILVLVAAIFLEQDNVVL